MKFVLILINAAAVAGDFAVLPPLGYFLVAANSFCVGGLCYALYREITD